MILCNIRSLLKFQLRLKQSLHIFLELHSQTHVQSPKDSSARITALSYPSHKIYCQSLEKDWPSCLSIGMARKHQFLVSSTVLIPATHEKLFHVTHLEENFFFFPKVASMCQERLQTIPITTKFLHCSSRSQMSCILLGLLVFY